MNNIIWVNILKGLGILAVVAGHIYSGQISRNIYIFHMPLFFFISGFLLKPSHDFNFFFIKKIKSLIIPYFVFLSVLYPIFYGYPSLNIEEVLSFIYNPLIGGRLLVGVFGSFWFITCLFLTQQLMNYLISKLSTKKNVYIMILFVLLSSINSYKPSLWLPWNAHVVFASAPIFYIGYFYQKSSIINSRLIALGGILVLILSTIFQNNVYHMKFTGYGYPLITLFSSIILILNIVNLSKLISKFKILANVLSEIGKSSLVIMFLHQPFQIFIKTYISLNNSIRLTISVLLSYVVYWIFLKSNFTRKIFLGKFLANKN